MCIRDRLKAQLEQVDKQIATQFSGLSALGITVNTADDLPAAASAIAQTLIQVNTGIEQCQSGLDQIAPVSYTHLLLRNCK